MTDQTQELQAVKRKIRALIEKTPENGATEAEFMFAMKKVGELLTQYNLNMTEVTLREEVCTTKTFNSGSKRRDVLWNISSGLATFLGLKHYYTRSHTGMIWHFFGLEQDVDMALYLCEFVQKAERTATAEFKRSDIYKSFTGNRIVATNSFQNGFGRRVRDRLIDMAREAEREERKANEFHAEQAKAAGTMVEASEEAIVEAARQKTGTALMCVAKAKKVEDEFKKNGPKLRYTVARSSARTNYDAFSAGSAAGSRLNLSRPVTGGSKVSGLLG
jgi:hypothetical protein